MLRLDNVQGKQALEGKSSYADCRPSAFAGCREGSNKEQFVSTFGDFATAKIVGLTVGGQMQKVIISILAVNAAYKARAYSLFA
jgi:hypothetical protein